MAKKYFNQSKQAEILEAEVVSVEVAEPASEAAAGEPKAKIVSRAVYSAFYGASYGVVFGSLLVAKLIIPKNSLIETAIQDGATAARVAVNEEKTTAEVAEESAASFDEAAPVAA
jgi:hypothetical protein